LAQLSSGSTIIAIDIERSLPPVKTSAMAQSLFHNLCGLGRECRELPVDKVRCDEVFPVEEFANCCSLVLGPTAKPPSVYRTPVN
jgi:hypothetical protein